MLSNADVDADTDDSDGEDWWPSHPRAPTRREASTSWAAQVCSARGTNSMDDDSSLAWLSDVMWLLEADDEDAEADFSLHRYVSGRHRSSHFGDPHPRKWGSR